MESKFKEGDCVQLKHGASPKMNVTNISINPFTQGTDIKCTWYEKSKMESQTFNEEILRPCEKEPTNEQKIKAMQEIIPPRKN